MRKRESGGNHEGNTQQQRQQERKRRGAERANARVSASQEEREREREERGIDSTRHHDTTRWRRGHSQTGLTLVHGRDSADIP